MKTKALYPAIIILSFIVMSCSNSDRTSDAYGNFEAIETTVSAEIQGNIIKLDFEEGNNVKEDQIIGIIDTTQIYLKLKQTKAQRESIASKTKNITAQIDIYKQQLANLEKDRDRAEKLVTDKAAPQKQLDDINNAIEVMQKQIDALRTQHAPILSELDAIDYQIKQIEDQLNRCYIKAPVSGTILEKYIELGEYASPGKSLCKLASLDEIILKAYITEPQLSQVTTGMNVDVLTDKKDNELDKTTGIVTWVSPSSEFTPKIIQTRDERQNLVYAIKIKVKNDGRYKIGMPAEVCFINK